MSLLVELTQWTYDGESMYYRQLGKQAQLVIDVIKVNTDKDIQVNHVLPSVHVHVHVHVHVLAPTC